MVLIGLMLAVLLGLAGMAIDLGVVYVERRELRTGADAAALAIAEDCGTGARACDEATALATAQLYADANAGDGASTVESVELNLNGDGTGSVRVGTSAWDAAAARSGVRTPLLSMLGVNGVEVGAAATAIFDFPSSQGGLPLIIDECEHDQATSNQTAYGVSVTLIFKDPSQDSGEGCPADPAGKDAPGAFGWLETDGANCWAQWDTSPPWPQADPGASPSRGCSPSDLRALLGEEVTIPIYEDICGDAAGEHCEDKDGGGNHTYYAVSGSASFVIQNYFFSGQYRSHPDFSCGTENSSDRCIQGYFTTATTPTGEPGGRDFGLVLVKLVE
jgi:hypothetical protein